MSDDDPVLVRATAHLAGGIYPGMYFWADRSYPKVREAIDANVLIVQEDVEPPELPDPTNLETRGWPGDV